MQIKQSLVNLVQRKQLVILLMVVLRIVHSLDMVPIQSENDRMKLAVEKSSNEWAY